MVPHQNSWGPNLIQALQNMYYNTISASIDEGMAFDMTTDPVRMPQQTETSVYVSGGWAGRTVTDIVNDCEAAYQAGNRACVIMSHPQEYAENKFTTTQLSSLKTSLENKGWSSTTFDWVAKNYVPARPAPAPTAPAPTPVYPIVSLYGQCGYASTTFYGYNCETGTYCKYSNVWWSACNLCTDAPVTSMDCEQHNLHCTNKFTYCQP